MLCRPCLAPGGQTGGPASPSAPWAARTHSLSGAPGRKARPFWAPSCLRWGQG